MNNWFQRVFLTSFKFIAISLLFTLFGSVTAANFKPYEIKAVYIYKIANFVRWPDEDKRTQLIFCFIGDGDVQRTFIKMAEDKSIRGMQLVVGDSEQSCDLTYLEDRFTSASFSNKQLVIGDKKGFVQRGGFIELRNINGKIHPVINQDRVQSSALKISSKLLRVATLEEGQG